MLEMHRRVESLVPTAVRVVLQSGATELLSLLVPHFETQAKTDLAAIMSLSLPLHVDIMNDNTAYVTRSRDDSAAGEVFSQSPSYFSNIQSSQQVENTNSEDADGDLIRCVPPLYTAIQLAGHTNWISQIRNWRPQNTLSAIENLTGEQLNTFKTFVPNILRHLNQKIDYLRRIFWLNSQNTHLLLSSILDCLTVSASLLKKSLLNIPVT